MIEGLVLRLMGWAYGAWALIAPDAAGASAARLFFTPRRSIKRHPPAGRPSWEGALHTGYARQWGDGARSIFLLHGWEGSWTQFTDFIETFTQADFTVFTLDPPAHGSAGGKISNPRLFAETLSAAEARFGTPDLAVGHSMGGAALMLALANGFGARKAALISTPVSPAPIIEEFEDMLHMGRRLRRSVRAQIEQIVGIPLDQMSAETLLWESRTPGLVIHDRNDTRINPAHAELIAGAWPQAELIFTEGLGHGRILNSSTAQSTLDWLKQGAAKSRPRPELV